MARQAWEPSDDERRRVRMLAGLGLTQEQIAHVVGVNFKTLAKYCREELDIGKAETLAKVAGGLVKRALAGDTTSAIFYLKTQGGWRETSRHEHSGPDGEPIHYNLTEVRRTIVDPHDPDAEEV